MVLKPFTEHHGWQLGKKKKKEEAISGTAFEVFVLIMHQSVCSASQSRSGERMPPHWMLDCVSGSPFSALQSSVKTVKEEANSAFMNSLLCHCAPGLGGGKAHPVCMKRSGVASSSSKWLEFPSHNSANSHLKMSPARVDGISMKTCFNEHYTDDCFHCEILVIFWKGCPAGRGKISILRPISRSTTLAL